MIFYGHEHYLAGKEIAYNGNTPAHVFCGGSLCNGSDWTQSEFLPVYMILINKNLLDMVLDGMEKQKFIIKNH